MGTICDKCGLEYFVSTHDLMHELVLLKVALKDLRHDVDHPVIRQNTKETLDSVIGWIDLKLVTYKGG